MAASKERIEQDKVLIDYLKHLTTISTGSIVLVATFIDKFFSHPYRKPALIISLVGFLLAVVSSIAALTGALGQVILWDREPIRKDWTEKLAMIGIYSSWASLIIGVSALGVFAVRNLI